ncbi:hypothetical protein QJQ45_026194 [Haematococcus lacustris]|nr:hypothetical protein QJQ45_026194 [Haematococcus lacustris]
MSMQKNLDLPSSFVLYQKCIHWPTRRDTAVLINALRLTVATRKYASVFKAIMYIPHRGIGRYATQIAINHASSILTSRVISAVQVVLISGSTCVWEPGVNRQLECTEGKSLEVVCLWGLPLPLPSSLSLFAAPARQGTLVHCQVVVPHLPAAPAHQLRLVGSAPQLGSWQPQHGLLLEQQQHAGSSMWVGEVDLPTNVSLTAKLVVLGPSGLPQWEAGADRTLLLEPRAASSAAEGSGFIIMCHYGLPRSQVFFRSWLPGGCLMVMAAKWIPDGMESRLGVCRRVGLGSRCKQPIAGPCHRSAYCPHCTSSRHIDAVPEFRTRPGQSLLLVGSLPVLGQWNPAAGLPLSWRAGNAWQGSLLMDPGDELEAKVVLSESSGSYVWEPGPNRRISARHLLGTHTCPPAALPALAAPSPPLAASTARLQGAGSTAAVPQSPGHRVPAEVFLTLAWGVNSMPALLVPAARPQSLPQPQAPPATPAEAGEQAAKDDHTTAEDQGLLHFLSFLLAQNLSLATAAPSPTSSWDTAPTSAHTLDSKDNILATDGIPASHAVASHKLVGRRASHVARAHAAVTESPGRLQALTAQASQLRDEVVAMEMRNSMLQSRLHEAQSRMAMAEAELRAELQQQQQRNKEQQRQLEQQGLDREQQQRLQQQQEEQHAASITALEQRMAAELEAARQEVASLQARVLELEAEQAATEARLQPAEEELTRLRQEVHQRTLELQELDAGSRTKLAALVEQHRVELAALQAGLLEVKSGAGAHLSTVRAAAAEAAAAAAASAIVQQQRITDLQQQGQALQAEVQCLNKELAAAKVGGEELRAVLQRQQQLAVEAGQLYAAQLAAQRSELQAAAAAQQAALTARFHQQLLDASQKQAQIVTAHERSLAQQQRALQEEAAKFAREASGLRDTISSLQASAVAGAEQLGALETELMAVRGEHSTALAVAQARSEQELCKARMALDAKLMDASQAAGVDKARWQASLAALTAAHDEQVAELQAASVAQLRYAQEQAALQLQQMATAHCEDLASAEQKLLVYQSELTRQQELLEVQRAEAGSAARSALDAEQQAETLAAQNGQLQTALIIAQQGAQSAEAHLAGLQAEVVAMREQQSQALAQLRSQHALEVSQLELAQSQELIKAQDDFHAKLAAVRSALVRMREEHAAEVKRLQEGIAASTAELQQRREAELQLTATIRRHSGQLASLQAEHDRELQVLREGARLALEQQTLASSASLQQLQRQLLDVQASADTALTSRLAELQQQHAAEVASLTQASAAGEAALQVAMAQVHAATQQQLQALHTSLAEQLAAAHAAASAAQAQLQQQLDAVHAASEESQLDLRSQLQQAEEAKAAQLADLWLLNEQQLAEQRLAFNTALSGARAGAVAAQTQAVQQERHTAAQALREAERAAAARVTALEEAHSSRILGLQEQLQQAAHQHSATEAALQAELQEVRSAAAEEAERLQAAQLSREAAVQAEIVARTRQHQEQLHTLRKGHAEDVATLIACHRQREEEAAAAMQLRTQQQVAAVREELQAQLKTQQVQWQPNKD